MKLLNLACGKTRHPDWTNVDKVGGTGVQVHDVLEPLPFDDDEFDVIYHSHLLEHLPKRFAPLFLEECRRVLKPGGILRVAVPDLKEICRIYLDNLRLAMNGDEEAAERYDWTVIELLDQLSRHRVGGEMLKYWKQKPLPAKEFVIGRMGEQVQRSIKMLRGSSQKPNMVGRPFPREMDSNRVGKFRLSGQPHLWMYDEFSLRRLLRQAGFCEIQRCEAGESQIPGFNSYQLDVNADGEPRKPDSLFFEAKLRVPEIHETPLALLIYNRPDKVAKMIEALALFKPSPLYVFSDGPKGPTDTRLVRWCRDLVAARVNWTEPVVVKRRRNWGLAQSVVKAVDRVLSEHDRVVVLEDDCIPGPHFMEFMKRCLDKYQDVEQVMAVTGYTFPVPQQVRDDYPWDAYFLHRIGSWGWGTWRRAWRHYERDLRAAYDEAIRRGVDLAQCGGDAKRYIEEQLERPRDTWTPNWILTLYLRNAYCVYPTVSHLRNVGHDGTGANSRDTKKYDVTLAAELLTTLPDELVVSEAMLDNYRGLLP